MPKNLEGIDLIKRVGPIVRDAGSIILSYFHKKLTRNEKGENGFVTEADLASEKFLINELKKITPEASFFAEESGKTEKGNSYCWVIDPLDGTTNFAHEIPYFCISVALTYNDNPIFGMIYQPLLDELFYAQEGKGAYCNGRPIHVSSPAGLDKCFLGMGVPYIKDERFEKLLRRGWTIAQKSYAMRTFGAVALDLANVACGRLDGALFENLGWWDVAAGIVIIREAGGKITDFEGKPLDPGYKSCLAASLPMHKELLQLCR